MEKRGWIIVSAHTNEWLSYTNEEVEPNFDVEQAIKDLRADGHDELLIAYHFDKEIEYNISERK